MSDDITKAAQDGADANLDEFKPRTEDEIRQSVITEFELDEEIDTDRIDKLVKKEVEYEKKFSTVLRQKQDYRDKFKREGETKTQYIQRMKDAGLDPETGQPLKKDLTSDDIDKRLDEKLDNRLFERGLDSLKISDEVKKELRDYCKFKKVSLEEGLNSSFIQSLISDEDREAMNESASLMGGRIARSAITKVKEPDKANFDLKTKDGRTAYSDACLKYKNSLIGG